MTEQQLRRSMFELVLALSRLLNDILISSESTDTLNVKYNGGKFDGTQKFYSELFAPERGCRFIERLWLDAEGDGIKDSFHGAQKA